MTAVIARIVLRYAAGALIAKGLLAPDLGTQISLDPDLVSLVEVILGGALMVVSEGWYYLARRFGWAK